MHPDQLLRLVEFLQTHPETAMVYADYTAIDAAGRPLSDPKFRPQNRRAPHDPEIHLPDGRSFGEDVDNFIGPCFLYRGRAGRLLGEYDPIQGIEDFDYWLRMSLVGRIDHLDSDQPLYRYRIHDNSLSGRALELKIYDHAHELMDYHRARKDYWAKPWTIYADEATMAWLDATVAGVHRVVPWSGGETAASACLLQKERVGWDKPSAVPPTTAIDVVGQRSACPTLRSATESKDEKRLLLLHAGSLPAVSAGETPCAAIAAWFPAGATDQAGIEAAANADLCFAEDDAAAARLALCCPRVFRAKPGPELLGTGRAVGQQPDVFRVHAAETTTVAHASPRIQPRESPRPGHVAGR